MAVMAEPRPPVLHPALICVADVDTRLTCSSCCPMCRYYMRDRRAGERGVKVRLLVSHWGAKPKSAALRSVQALAAHPNIEVRVLTVPAWSGGEIPFARVTHAKFMVADGRTAWVGTSNWEGDYFLKTRNVAIVAEGGALAPRLDKIFADDWSSAYTAPLAK